MFDRTLYVTPADIHNGTCGNSRKCAMAQALFREWELSEENGDWAEARCFSGGTVCKDGKWINIEWKNCESVDEYQGNFDCCLDVPPAEFKYRVTETFEYSI